MESSLVRNAFESREWFPYLVRAHSIGITISEKSDLESPEAGGCYIFFPSYVESRYINDRSGMSQHI
jgi:hypothetical protein